MENNLFGVFGFDFVHGGVGGCSLAPGVGGVCMAGPL